jgi:hypothetical protein
MERIEKSLKQYFAELDLADQEDLKIHAIDTDKLKDKIAALKSRMTELKVLEEKIRIHNAVIATIQNNGLGDFA